MGYIEEKIAASISKRKLPERQKQQLITYIKNEIELRSGRRISEQLSDNQKNELFEIMEGSIWQNKKWLFQNLPNDQRQSEILTLIASDSSDAEKVNQLACSLWLQNMVPAYQQIVEDCIDEVLMENQLLGNKLN